jgi:2'-5' RNA ligase
VPTVEAGRNLRTFVAIELPEEARGAAAEALQALRQTEVARSVEARWSRPEGLHLTLHFLGSTEPASLPSIEAALGSLAKAQLPFSLCLGGTGCFPSARRPQILWLGIRGALTEVAALSAAVGQVLGPLGFPPEPRDFTPHLTLARLKDHRGGRLLARALQEVTMPSSVEWQVRDLALLESRPGPGGSTYHHLARFSFAQA